MLHHMIAVGGWVASVMVDKSNRVSWQGMHCPSHCPWLPVIHKHNSAVSRPQSLSPRLVPQSFVEASRVALDYLGDADDAVRLLCRGGQWKEALRECWRLGRRDLADTVVLPMAAERADAMVEEAAELPDKARKTRGGLEWRGDTRDAELISVWAAWLAAARAVGLGEQFIAAWSSVSPDSKPLNRDAGRQVRPAAGGPAESQGGDERGDGGGRGGCGQCGRHVGGEPGIHAVVRDERVHHAHGGDDGRGHVDRRSVDGRGPGPKEGRRAWQGQGTHPGGRGGASATRSLNATSTATSLALMGCCWDRMKHPVRAVLQNEEAKLAEHVFSLGPTPEMLRECGALAEVLYPRHRAYCVRMQAVVGHALEAFLASARGLLADVPTPTPLPPDATGEESRPPLPIVV